MESNLKADPNRIDAKAMGAVMATYKESLAEVSAKLPSLQKDCEKLEKEHKSLFKKVQKEFKAKEAARLSPIEKKALEVIRKEKDISKELGDAYCPTKRLKEDAEFKKSLLEIIDNGKLSKKYAQALKTPEAKESKKIIAQYKKKEKELDKYIKHNGNDAVYKFLQSNGMYHLNFGLSFEQVRYISLLADRRTEDRQEAKKMEPSHGKISKYSSVIKNDIKKSIDEKRKELKEDIKVSGVFSRLRGIAIPPSVSYYTLSLELENLNELEKLISKNPPNPENIREAFKAATGCPLDEDVLKAYDEREKAVSENPEIFKDRIKSAQLHQANQAKLRNAGNKEISAISDTTQIDKPELSAIEIMGEYAKVVGKPLGMGEINAIKGSGDFLKNLVNHPDLKIDTEIHLDGVKEQADKHLQMGKKAIGKQGVVQHFIGQIIETLLDKTKSGAKTTKMGIRQLEDTKRQVNELVQHFEKGEHKELAAKYYNITGQHLDAKAVAGAIPEVLNNNEGLKSIEKGIKRNSTVYNVLNGVVSVVVATGISIATMGAGTGAAVAALFGTSAINLGLTIANNFRVDGGYGNLDPGEKRTAKNVGKEILSVAKGWLTEVAMGGLMIVKPIANAVNTITTAIGNGVKTAWNGVKTGVSLVGKGIANAGIGLWNTIKGAASGIKATVGKIFQKGVEQGAAAIIPQAVTNTIQTNLTKYLSMNATETFQKIATKAAEKAAKTAAETSAKEATRTAATNKAIAFGKKAATDTAIGVAKDTLKQIAIEEFLPRFQKDLDEYKAERFGNADWNKLTKAQMEEINEFTQKEFMKSVDLEAVLHNAQGKQVVEGIMFQNPQVQEIFGVYVDQMAKHFYNGRSLSKLTQSEQEKVKDFALKAFRSSDEYRETIKKFEAEIKQMKVSKPEKIDTTPDNPTEAPKKESELKLYPEGKNDAQFDLTRSAEIIANALNEANKKAEGKPEEVSKEVVVETKRDRVLAMLGLKPKQETAKTEAPESEAKKNLSDEKLADILNKRK